jgi:hypothetical protein
MYALQCCSQRKRLGIVYRVQTNVILVRAGQDQLEWRVKGRRKVNCGFVMVVKPLVSTVAWTEVCEARCDLCVCNALIAGQFTVL